MKVLVVAVAFFLSPIASADIVVKPEGTWTCDSGCTITPLGGGKIKICTQDPKTGAQFSATLDSKDYKEAAPSKPGPDSSD